MRMMLGALLGVLLATAAYAQETHTVTDMTGAQVQVPAKVDRIAEQFPAHTVTGIMLGAGDRIVAIPQNVKTLPFLKRVYPRIADIPELFRNGGVNIEELLARKPDVVSAVAGGANLKPFQTAGIPALVMAFNTLPQLIPSITLAGEVYGGPARDRAKAYTDYLQGRIDFVKGRLAKLPADQRPSVVHISSYPPLVIDGGPSLIDDWIKLAGGTDPAEQVGGAHVGVTIEQLLKWDPDVLLVETPGGDQGLRADSGASILTALAKAPGWSGLKAVKAGHVYMNPQGMYPWDRFGPEEALQIPWAAKTLHPDLFKDLDIRAEARTFYKNFFGYDLPDSELDLILQTGH